MKRFVSCIFMVALLTGNVNSFSYAQDKVIPIIENETKHENIEGDEKNFLEEQAVLQVEGGEEKAGESVNKNIDEQEEKQEKPLNAQSDEQGGQIKNNKTGEVYATAKVKSWEFEQIKFNVQSPQEKMKDIIILPQIINATEDLQYKFVWMKDEWKEWGVIKNFSKESSAVWTPSESGTYTICVDVKDGEGKIATQREKYVITKLDWTYKGISPEEETIKTGQEIELKVDLLGNTDGLQYKYVWQRDNWKEWGIIKGFSKERGAKFIPQKSGIYTIIVDIKDSEGDVKSKKKIYTAKNNIWEYDGIETSVPSPQEKYSDPIKISVKTSGENEKLQYKYVWQKDNWKKWGVIRSFSKEKSVFWKPVEEGDYSLLVDIKDDDGEITTKSLSYKITKLNWKVEDIQINPEGKQKKGEPINIEVRTTGNTKGLQYKYVWQRDNWKEWGVIKGFSEENTLIWTAPNKSGQYKIIVDVKDRDGKIVSKEVDYAVSEQNWSPGEIIINEGEEGKAYTKIPIEVNMLEEIENLQYKFVWMKDDWKEWGVIKNFDDKSFTSAWIPKTTGKYTIFVDIIDNDGIKRTINKEYAVVEKDWTLQELKINGSRDRFVGDKLKVTAITTGNIGGLKYKFVCQRGNDWNDWETVQGFSANNNVEIPLNKDKDYHVYVDIMNKEGVICKTEMLTVRVHKYISAGVSSTKISKGKTIQVYPNLSGSKATPNVKYVWMKNNWKEWGVLKEFSASSSVDWTPTTVGVYTFIVDVEMNGIVHSNRVQVEVTDKKNGWYYENGYKFYYKDGVKQLDLDGILAKQSSYYIKVNRKTCSVTVYAKDGNKGYIIPVKRFACSVGLPSTPTPAGTYYTPAKYRWRTLMGPSYGQYCTRITGSILFHSVAGRNMTSYNLNARDYNKLGQPASHGCVRLNVRDAKWIYDNCALKTKVTIYDSSDPGPLGKPMTIKIPAGQTWDPTDPNIKR